MDDIDAIRRLGQGRFLADLAAALLAVGEEVIATGKKGSVSATLEITTTEQGDPMLQISEKIVRKSPTKAPRGGWLFVQEGELYDQDPRQPRLINSRLVDVQRPNVRDAEAPAPTIREVQE